MKVANRLLRQFCAAVLCTLCAVVAVETLAQSYPSRSIRFVDAYAAGGGTDTVARILAEKLTELLAQPVVVDNRAGGTGAVGSAFVAQAPADGYTLLIVTSSTHAISPSLNSNLPYHPVKDFAPVSLIATGPNAMSVHPSVPANSVKELVTLAKAQPNKLNYASNGLGSLGHMTAELFKTATGTRIVHVPYKSSNFAITDLLSGYVQLMFSAPNSILPHMYAHKLKVLAITNPQRAEGPLKDIPTFIEAGYPAVNAGQWYGVVTTAGTPQTVVDRLNSEFVRVLRMPDVKERLLGIGFIAKSSSPQEFGQLIKDELAKWQKVVKDAGVRVE